jgi:hypothetical protein
LIIRARSITPMPIILVILLGVYSVIDSLSLGLGTEQRIAYGVLFCVTILLILFARARAPQPKSLGRVIGAWWLIGLIGFVMILTQETVYPVYIVGDAASFLYPAMLLLMAKKDATAFRHMPTIAIAAVWMVVASLMAAFVFPHFGYGGDRFQEPPLLLMAVTLVGLLRPTRPGLFVLSAVTTIILIYITLLSGARLALMLWPVMACVLLLMGHVPKQFAMAGLCGLVGLVPLADLAFDRLGLAENVAQSRLAQSFEHLDGSRLVAGMVEDGSMNNRIMESSDALYTRYDYQGILSWIFGSGHGATFEGATAYYGDRLLSNGDVHHIHFGLVLLYYRYGIPGVIGFFWLFLAAFRQMWFLRRCSPKSPLYYPSLLFTVAGIAYLLNFLLFNELIDPAFSFALAGFLTTRDLAAPARRFARQSVFGAGSFGRFAAPKLAVTPSYVHKPLTDSQSARTSLPRRRR